MAFTRTRLVIACAVVALATAAAVVLAQQVPPPDTQSAPSPQRFGAPPMLDRLNLTEQQRAELQALVAPTGEMAALGQKVMALQRELNAAIFAESPDGARIEELEAALNEAQVRLLAGRIGVQQRIAQILTAEQRKLVVEQPGLFPLVGGPGMPGGRGRGPGRGGIGHDPHSSRQGPAESPSAPAAASPSRSA
jgi:Spy/CpxP family protein refolding chaperone